MSTPSGPVTLMVTDVFASQYATQLDALRNVGRGLELVVVDASTPRGTEAEVAFFSPDEFPGNTARLLPRARDAASIKWFHTMTAGVDNPVFLSFPARGVRLTTSSGATAIPIAQSVVLDLLALTRRMRETLGHQAAHRWERLMGADVAGGTAVVVGMGPIGYEVARLLSALRMSVIGLRRSVAGDEPCETWTFDRWPEAVRRADVVVMAVPLTDDTRHLLDAPSLAALRPGAIVINIGRGELIDEEALIESLRSGHLGGAGLDVFTVEPLPADSPLWDLPNVIITPHSSGLTPSTRVAMCEIFLDNLGRYLRDEPLRNEVLPS